MNWRSTPLVDLAMLVSLIGSTRSRGGLHVRAELDRGHNPAGVLHHLPHALTPLTTVIS